MNKELAIECIKTQRQFVDDTTREAFDMAIEALKTDPYIWEKCPYYEPDMIFDGKEEYDCGKCVYQTQSCEDCVSREDVLKKIYLANTSPIGSENILQELSYSISHMPSVQPKRARGEWIPHTIGFRKCSCCNSIWSSDITNNIFTNYCPRCGADMRGEHE